jgi:hypothetical protein
MHDLRAIPKPVLEVCENSSAPSGDALYCADARWIDPLGSSEYLAGGQVTSDEHFGHRHSLLKRDLRAVEAELIPALDLRIDADIRIEATTEAFGCTDWSNSAVTPAGTAICTRCWPIRPSQRATTGGPE